MSNAGKPDVVAGKPDVVADSSHLILRFNDLERRLSSLESKAVADFVAADSFLKRNVNWILPLAMLASGFLGYSLHG